MAYRSTGLGIYAVIIRYITMPLEKGAMIMNSSQVGGSNQLSQAMRIVFADGPLTPFRTVKAGSVVAWFFQYSVLGFVFQACDRSLSAAMGVQQVPYGDQLMKPPPKNETPISIVDSGKMLSKAVLAPFLSGIIESGVANRAEAQRFYGPEKLTKIEAKLKWGAVPRACGPAFWSNVTRNFVMSGTSFVVTPTLYQRYFPQEQKNQGSLFWFGLGVNIFFGNVIAISQQALWGRALDYAAVDGGRAVSYGAVVREGLKAEGAAAFITTPKWAARVAMNAPIQGTVPWFYNEILPLGEMQAMHWIFGAMQTMKLVD